MTNARLMNWAFALERNTMWYLITVDVDLPDEELAGSLLFELGATGLVNLEETPSSIKLGAYFEERAQPDEIARVLREQARTAGLSSLRDVSVSLVADEDWMKKWKEGFEPIEIGERLLIAPSWRLPSDSSRLVIQIDPGMAFGTGTHESTRLCLEALESHWRGGSMLDVGTGSGILSIAAAKLTPGSSIIAIDVDPQAVSVARENCAINGVSSQVETLESGPRAFASRSFTLVVANLTAEVIVDELPALTRCLGPSGTLVLSGILNELAADVERGLSTSGLALIERQEAGEWTMMAARHYQ